jgi:hypothetical protein
MADQVFGGRITLEFDGQVIVIANASVKLDVAGASSEAKANQDRSVCYQYTLKPFVAEFTPRDDSKIDWAVLMRRQGNATIAELDNGIIHLFTGCRVVGEPMQDRDTGEVSGVKIAGGQYQKING